MTVEFLVRMHTAIPPEMAPEELAELRQAERRRAMELRGAGLLVRLWRVPGQHAAIGLWEAPDATALHEALSSLPQFRWMELHVEPLATHPQEQAAREA